MSEEKKSTPEEKTKDQAAVSPTVTADKPQMQKVEEAKGRTAPHSDVQEHKSRRPKKGGRGAPRQEEDNPFVEKVLAIKRVAKATKGGTKLSFSALVVVGDTKGRVGYYLGKGNEVAIAIRKAMNAAKKRMITVPMNGSTIPHQVIGEWCGAQVLLKPAGEGTGVIASSAVRAVCDGAGIHNILTKCHRSNNAVNVVRATIEALKNLKTKDHYAGLRK